MAAKKATTIQDLWHYAVGSERRGPVPRATLASLLAAGEISAETYVWQPGMENWVHLGDAAPLKELVAGVGADRPIEVFVEEDTAFNTADELLAAHSALAAGETEEALPAAVIKEGAEDDDDDAVTGDTVIESVDDVFGALTVSYDEPEEVTLVGAGGDLFAEAAAAVPDADVDDDQDDPFAAIGPGAAGPAAYEPVVVASAGEAAASASGVDIFGDAEAEDIFAEASDEGAPIPAGKNVGAHSRHVNSVLFSLDDLGREDSSAPMPAGGDPFVTDSSGLIDIKAIADSQEDRHEYSDPFAVPVAPMASRAGVGTVAIPIVERRNNLGPWILAAALVLLVGGGIVAFLVMNGDSAPKENPVTVAAATTPPAETKAPAEVAGDPEDRKVDEAAKVAQDEAKAAATADEAKVEGGDAQGTAKTAEGDQAAAGDEAKTADGGEAGEAANGAAEEPSDEEMKAAIAKAEADARAKAEAAAKAHTPTRVKKPTTPKSTHTTAVATAPKDPPPEARIEVAAAPKTTSSSGNTRKVNALLEKLNNPNEGTTSSDTPETNMPKKLSAASLRQTLRQNRARFAKCGASLGADASSVKVTTSFVIQGSTGAVQSARIVNGGGTSADVQRCVVSELKNTVFGRFSDATMTVNFPIQLM